MIGQDIFVFARDYIDDAGDAQAKRQRLAVRRLIESGWALTVSKTVVLELEWVMRGYYGFSQTEVACTNVATFDDRKFVRRAKKLGMAPTVTMLS